MSDSTNRLINSISKLGADTVSELSYGTVTSVNPLVITRDAKESRIPLTSGFLVLSKTCKELSVTIQGDRVQLWTGLSVGEKVILLSFNGSQKFFVERT